jgi:uncharacterized membrane protein YwaF
MKQQLESLENYLAGVFKNAPKISENGRRGLVNAMPWIALVFGILQVISTLGLWGMGRRVNDFAVGINTLARQYGVESTVPELSIFFWIALFFIGVSAIFLLLAYPGLKDRKKVGWDWLFYGALVNLLYGVVSLFFDNYYGGGFGRLFSAILGTAITFWILFQVRDAYLPKKDAKKAVK